MAERGPKNMLLLAAFSCLAMATRIEANMVFYDGFTIEMPVWFELIPHLRPPLMGPYKETAGHPNAVTNDMNVPGRGQYPVQLQPNRAPQMEYSPPSYANMVQLQPKPVQYPQYPRAPEVYYRPTMGPRLPVTYTAPTTTKTTTSTGIPPAPRREEEEPLDDYHEDIDEEA